MNSQQFLIKEGKVILKTDVIFTHLNFDKRENYSLRNKQMEINFSESSVDKVKKTNHITYSSTMTMADFNLLSSTLNSLIKIYKHLTRALLNQFPAINFEFMVNDEHTTVSENYLHLLACKNNGTTLSFEETENIHNYLNNIFFEIDELIIKINKTTYMKDISSIKLVSQAIEKNDHIKFINRVSAEFTYALFNSDIKNIKLATIIHMNKKILNLTKPIIQDQKTFLDMPHIIHGTLEVESRKSRKIHANGFYLDGNTITNKLFNEMVFCKATGSEKEKHEQLFSYIDNELSEIKVKFMIKTLQPYVCLEGVGSKVKHLFSIEEPEERLPNVMNINGMEIALAPQNDLNAIDTVE